MFWLCIMTHTTESKVRRLHTYTTIRVADRYYMVVINQKSAAQSSRKGSITLRAISASFYKQGRGPGERLS